MQMQMLKGLILLAAGVIFVVLAEKKEFDKTDRNGVEKFKTFREFAANRFTNGLYRWLGLVLFMFGGLLMLAANIRS